MNTTRASFSVPSSMARESDLPTMRSITRSGGSPGSEMKSLTVTM